MKATTTPTTDANAPNNPAIMRQNPCNTKPGLVTLLPDAISESQGNPNQRATALTVNALTLCRAV